MNTFATLVKKGLPTFNYETHIARRFNKAKIRETFARFGEETVEKCLFSSLYYNQHFEKPDVMLKTNGFNIKAGIHRAYDNPDKLIGEIKGKVFLNYSDPAVNELFKRTVTKIMKGDIKV